MNLKYIVLFLFFHPFYTFGQAKGVVTDDKAKPQPFVNVYVEGTYTGTTTNENGKFELFVKKEHIGKNLVFQSLGYKTQKTPIQNLNQINNVILIEESYDLQEVTINTKENPANAIIRKAINNKKINSEPYVRFTADFYSRGVFKLKNMPKKILGQEVGDLDGSLDSTGTGIVYLSETISKVAFDKPDKFSETIIASKLSGDNRGYSYNTAMGANFDFYSNTTELMGMKMISPLADNSFVYYKFNLESSFKDVNGFLINKIKLIPRRDQEPIFDGYIYIVEDSWHIYAVELSTKGSRMANEFTDILEIRQNYTYNATDSIWAKHLQAIDIQAGVFGINFYGKFNHVFTNYNFSKTFVKGDFSKEVVRYELASNKKTDDFWLTTRPIPLTEEEEHDYVKKDSIKEIRTSKKYLDSVDTVQNKLKFSKLIMGYTYKDSYEKWGINYDGLLNVGNFNTVQGWVIRSGFSFYKNREEPNQTTRISSNIEYGFSEKKWRPDFSFYKRFNTINYANLQINVGLKTQQYNENNPVLPISNTISSLYFRNNYLKIFDKKYASIHYNSDISSGFHIKTGLEYAARSPLRNSDFRSWYQKDKIYTSNNPIEPYTEHLDAFEKHNLLIFNISTYLTFGQKYINRPERRINITTKNYPKLRLTYKKGLLGSNSKNNFDFAEIHSNYSNTFGNKGDFVVGVTAGKFFNVDDLTFIDFKHFKGNQTYVAGMGANSDRFHLLPYYSHSTSDSFFELHAEHNFKGYIMNKIPLINKLRTHLVLGYHQLSLPHQKPYMEFSVGLSNLGIGKFRFFRVDYVRSYQGRFINDGITVGTVFLDAFRN